MLLDELVLEQERVLDRGRDEHVQIGHTLEEMGDLVAAVPARTEIRAHTSPQALGLADIEHPAPTALEQVNPGARRQLVDAVLPAH